MSLYGLGVSLIFSAHLSHSEFNCRSSFISLNYPSMDLFQLLSRDHSLPHHRLLLSHQKRLVTIDCSHRIYF